MVNIKISGIKWVIIVTLILKSTLILSYGDFTQMNSDEERNYLIASNYLDGKGYTIDDELTSFHGSFTVMIYKSIIEYKIEKESYISFVYIVSILIFALSILFFYKIILISGGMSEKLALAATVVYSIYPSSLIYIGNHFFYENIVLSLLIITFYYLFNTIKNSESSNYVYLIPIIVSISCLLRMQMILIYFVIFTVFFIYSLHNRNRIESFKRFVGISILTAVMLISVNVPFLQKNHTMFGSYILATQSGMALMIGHNNLARGSWDGTRDYSKNLLPNIEQLNEYEKNVAMKEHAINWIKQNPLKELKLIARKIAIFMLPKNHESGYNIINIVVHSLFIISLALALIKKQLNSTTFLFLSPIVGALLLSLIFFVGFRWRYYAEPFFILFLFYQLNIYFSKRKLI